MPPSNVYRPKRIISVPFCLDILTVLYDMESEAMKNFIRSQFTITILKLSGIEQIF
jgi:hypothetical protein